MLQPSFGEMHKLRKQFKLVIGPRPLEGARVFVLVL